MKTTSTKKNRDKVALYLRVSTGMQTTENQERDLREAAEAKGLEVVHVYKDEGISGAKGRDRRPGLDAALKDAVRGKYGVLMAWSLDRVGRSLRDLVNTLHELETAGVELYLHKQGLDTRTAVGCAMFQMVGMFAEFERELIRERVLAGMTRAKERGTKSGQPIGRPGLPEEKREEIIRLKGRGLSFRETARAAGVALATVQKVLKEAQAGTG